jgi:hypothetical protein
MTRQRFSEEDLIEALKKLVELLGRTPRARDADADPDVPCHSTYVNRFGSWRKALEAADIPLDPRNTGYDRETLLSHLRELAETLGRTPMHRDLKRTDGPCKPTYALHFGSWRKAVAEAGLEIRPPSKRYEREELLEILRELTEELGHTPSMAELWEREDLPTPSTYKYRFGRWNGALREAGLTPQHPGKYAEDAAEDEVRDGREQ